MIFSLSFIFLMRMQFETITAKRQERNIRTMNNENKINQLKIEEVFKTTNINDNLKEMECVKFKDTSNHAYFKQACKDISRYFHNTQEFSKNNILIPSNTSTLKLLYNARRSHSKALEINSPSKCSKLQLDNILTNDCSVKSFLKGNSEKYLSFTSYSKIKTSKNVQNTFLKKESTKNENEIKLVTNQPRNKINKYFENIIHLKSQSSTAQHLLTFFSKNHKKIISQNNFENVLNEMDKSNTKFPRSTFNELSTKDFKNFNSLNQVSSEKENNKKIPKKRNQKNIEINKPNFNPFVVLDKKLKLIQNDHPTTKKFFFLKILKLQELIDNCRKNQLKFYFRIFIRNIRIRRKCLRT